MKATTLVVFGLFLLILLIACGQAATGPDTSSAPTSEKQASAGKAGMVVYAKDAQGEVSSVTTTVTKVEATRSDGSTVLLYEGSQKMTLDAKTTSKIAQKEVDAGTYEEIRITLGQSATVTEKDGTTHTAAVQTAQIKGKVQEEVKAEQTTHVVFDIPLEGSLSLEGKSEATSGGYKVEEFTYVFAPKSEAKTSTAVTSGIELSGSLGIISASLESTLGITHSLGPIGVTANVVLDI